MRITANLKAWLVENCDVAKTASDAEFRKAAAEALADGSLQAEELVTLTKDVKDEQADTTVGLLKGLTTALSDLKGLLEKPAEKKEVEIEAKAVKTEVAVEKPKQKASSQPSELAKMVSRLSTGDAYDAGDDVKSFQIRVKEAAESYSSTKSAMIYPTANQKGRPHISAGLPVMDYSDPGMAGRPIDNPSQLDKAVIGAWCKMLVATAQRGGSRTFGFQSLPQHDKELIYYAMENMLWNGSSDGGDRADIKAQKLTPFLQKALIDDATSGGLEAAPIVFDDDVISAPLLNGELYPLVNVRPLDRGRRVEGVSTGTVTGAWGGVDDTAIALFTTTAYVAAFDTTIFRWEGAIRIGLDFLSDTPIDFGAHITSQYGERLLEDLDDVIATGNGTTQPEGVMTKSGTTTVAFGGVTSIGNYESLLFGVNKNERRPNVAASIVFCGTETSYQRARALPVDSTDARRLGGGLGTIGGVGDYLNWMWMGHSYKINESLTNAQIFYAVLGKYRMYRRRGLTMRTSTEGDTLIRNNEMLMVATARYGGQLERGATAAITTTAPV